MIFSEFCADILSPNLRIVAKHWSDARGNRVMPGWNDLSPNAIKGQLPIIWAYTYDPDQDEFFGRIVGDTVHKIFGRAFKGERMSVLQTAFDRPRLFERAKRVISTPALFHGLGAVFQQSESDSVGERIIMPLASDGRHPDGILGAVEFKVHCKPSSEDRAPEEEERWFDLKI